MMRWRSAATRVSVVASLGFLRSSISTVDLSLIVCALFLAAQAAARAPRRRFNVCWPGPTTKRGLRCAIYTRVSTDQGLEQDFNSLDAQREASEAYIKSQAH